MLKKFLSWIFAFIITFCFLGAGLFFTSIGNGILASFIQSGLNYVLPLQIQLQNLRISLGTLQADAIIEDSLSVKINGAYTLNNFNMALSLMDSNRTINLQGKAFGKYHNYKIILQPVESKNPKNSLNFEGNFSLLKVLNIHTTAEELNLKEIFGLINKNFIFEGSFKLAFNKQKDHFKLQLLSKDSHMLGYKIPLYFEAQKIDSILTQKADFILNNKRLRLEAKSTIQDGNTTTEASLLGANDKILAVLNIPKMQNHTGIFQLSFLDLEALGRELGMRYFGGLYFSGDFSYEPFFSQGLPNFMLNTQSDSLGGMLAISLKDENLQFQGTQLETSKILSLFVFSHKIESLVDIKGSYNFLFKRGELSIKSENIALDPIYAYEFSAESRFNSYVLDSTLTFTNPIHSFTSKQCTLNLADQNLTLRFDELPVFNSQDRHSLEISGKFWDLHFDMKDKQDKLDFEF